MMRSGRSPSSRYKEEHIRHLNESDAIWKRCDVCGLHFVVNAGFEDRKPRTPKFKGLVVCLDCDPRHREDRYLKEGYRVIHPRRMRVIAMALIAKNLAGKKCLSGKKKCKCVNCVARKLQLD